MPSPLYSQEPYLYVFLTAIGVWVVSDLSIGLRYRSQSQSPQDRGSKHAIGAAIAGGVLGSALLSTLVPSLRLPFPRVTFWTGIGLMVFGVAVRQYAAWTLEEYFSLEVSVDESDSVVTTGPYQWVRHPSYTGGLATLVGIGIAAGHWLSVGLTAIAGILGYGYRIRIEERALNDKLGESYEQYSTQTPYRLVPFIW